MNLRIREAAAADAAELATLINLAYRVEDFFIDGNRTDAEDVIAHLRSGLFLIAEQDARLVGAVYVELRGDARGYFGMLSVDPAVQGGGIGRKLIAAAENLCRARGCRIMELQVVDLRTELPPFYRRFGYEVSGTAPFPDVAKKKRACAFILMSKPLG